MADLHRGLELDYADPQDYWTLREPDYSREIELWRAVLRVAIEDAMGQTPANDLHITKAQRNSQTANEARARMQAEAIAWLRSDRDDPGSCRWVLRVTETVIPERFAKRIGIA